MTTPYMSVKEMQALGRLFGALRPAKLAAVKGCEGSGRFDVLPCLPADGIADAVDAQPQLRSQFNNGDASGRVPSSQIENQLLSQLGSPAASADGVAAFPGSVPVVVGLGPEQGLPQYRPRPSFALAGGT
jgi:hypothetical protein